MGKIGVMQFRSKSAVARYRARLNSRATLFIRHKPIHPQSGYWHLVAPREPRVGATRKSRGRPQNDRRGDPNGELPNAERNRIQAMDLFAKDEMRSNAELKDLSIYSQVKFRTTTSADSIKWPSGQIPESRDPLVAMRPEGYGSLGPFGVLTMCT